MNLYPAVQMGVIIRTTMMRLRNPERRISPKLPRHDDNYEAERLKHTAFGGAIGACLNLFLGLIGDDGAVFDRKDTVHIGGEAHIMGGDKSRDAFETGQIKQALEHIA